MRTTLAMKLAVPAAIAVLGVLGASPIGAQSPPTTVQQEVANLTVTKTVVGTAPSTAQFTLHITCSGSSITVESQVTDYDEDMTFGPTGGSKLFVFTGPSLCTITETDDGGANSSSGPVQVSIESPIDYSAEITNTFDPVVTPTTAPAAAAAAVQTTATFTG